MYMTPITTVATNGVDVRGKRSENARSYHHAKAGVFNDVINFHLPIGHDKLIKAGEIVPRIGKAAYPVISPMNSKRHSGSVSAIQKRLAVLCINGSIPTSANGYGV
jgi:hypothetical protein